MDSRSTQPTPQQYQRAVTPTIENNNAYSSTIVKGKVLAYSANQSRISKVNTKTVSGGAMGINRPSISNLSLTTSRPNNVISPRANVGGGSSSYQGSSSDSQGRTTLNGKAASANLNSFGLRYNSDGTTSGSTDSVSTLPPRYDLIPLSDEMPADGIVFARIRNHLDTIVVVRTQEERLRNPEV